MSKTLTDLRNLTRWYATGSSASTEFSDADTLVALNAHYQDAFLMATENDGDFEFNGDGSQSIDILSGTRAYSLATDLFKISRVELKYPSTSANYVEGKQISSSSMTTGKDSYAGSNEFDLIGSNIEIFVGDVTASIQAATAGIKVYYQKELTELSVAGDAIIFPDVFARYICLGAAADYCMTNGLTTRLQSLDIELQKMEQKLTEYIANRNNAKRNAIAFHKEDYGGGSGYGINDKQI